MTGADRADGLRSHVPAALVGGGVLLFALGVGQYLVFQGVSRLLTPFGLTNHALAFVLGGVVAACGLVVRRTDVSPARYPRIALWCCGCAVALLALNVPMMALIPDLSRGDLVGWGYNVLATGAAAGAIIGLLEARAIERARVAERRTVRAENAEAETQRLEYLNSVLRHEVLNNVNVIDGYAELARERTNSDRVADHLETIQHKSEDMADVITDVRVLIESIQPSEGLDAVNLATVLTGELDDLRTTYDHVEVEAEMPDDVYVVADELLPRVFGNLLTNAVEHNDSPIPRIDVTVERDDEAVTVRVADNGPGIPDEERDRLFERGTGDHGVGLYLVAALVDGYGGRVELTETGPEGSVFAVTLPRADPTSSSDVADAGGDDARHPVPATDD
ncbi:MAG: sensor histidine kinase [Haloplanus sp.]